MQTLKLAEQFFSEISAGQKRATIRTGYRDILPGPLLFQSPTSDTETVVEVTRVMYTNACDMTNEDAELDGYKDVPELMADLKRFYPSIAGTDLVTIVKFRPTISPQHSTQGEG